MLSRFATLSFFRYADRRSRWEAFVRMGQPPQGGSAIEGLRLVKPLGTGGGAGFSLWPDWSTYALLLGWAAEADARSAMESSAFIEAYRSGAAEERVFCLEPFLGHGCWDGSPVFEYSGRSPAGRVAVLTRARIKNVWAPVFWTRVGSVSKRLQGMEGLHFAKGVGSLPAIEQATFSVWESQDPLKRFAYAGKAHSAVVRTTRKTGWYSEELFARFSVLSEEVRRLG